MRHSKVIAAVTAAMLATSLAACSSDNDSSSTDSSAGSSTTATTDKLTVLSMWLPDTGEGDAQEAALAAFTQKTGIQVELSQAGQEVGATYETQHLAGADPDVVFVNLYDKTLGWTDNGATVDVKKYMDDWGLTDKVEPDALAAWTTTDGKVRAFPFQGFNWPVFWNTDALKAAGMSAPPKTTDELISLVGKAGSTIPIVTGGSDWTGEKMFSQIIQDQIPADEAMTLFSEGGWKDSAAARKGVELFTQLRDAGVFGKDVQGYTSDTMYADYNEGNAIGMSAGSWAYATTPEDRIATTTLGGFPLSASSVQDKPTAYRGFTSVGFWISPGGEKHIDAVQQLIQYMYSEENVSNYVKTANIVPAVKISDAGSLVDNALMAESLNKLPDEVSFIVLQDTYVPAASASGLSQAIALAYDSGKSVDDILAALDQAYGK